jgi:DNA-damage-inducible protein J
MTTQSTMLHVRVDSIIKDQATQTLAEMGLTMSDAVRILLRRIVADQAFPLELKVPNAKTLAAMAEAEEIVASRKARFNNAEELFASLEKNSRQ